MMKGSVVLKLFMDYHRQNNVRIKIVRIFNTYGPRMLPNDGRVVSNFLIQALKNDDITIYGTGEQTRSFQYIDDLVEGMIRMMNTGDDFIGPINLGNPNEFSMLQLAEKIIQKTGSKSKITFKPRTTIPNSVSLISDWHRKNWVGNRLFCWMKVWIV